MSSVRTKLMRNYCYKCWYYLESKLADRYNHYKKFCSKKKEKVYPGAKACDDFLKWWDERKRRDESRRWRS